LSSASCLRGGGHSNAFCFSPKPLVQNLTAVRQFCGIFSANLWLARFCRRHITAAEKPCLAARKIDASILPAVRLNAITCS
jgi:hypothetical protein